MDGWTINAPAGSVADPTSYTLMLFHVRMDDTDTTSMRPADAKDQQTVAPLRFPVQYMCVYRAQEESRTHRAGPNPLFARCVRPSGQP